MTVHLAYWTVAFLLMSGVVGAALRGHRLIRQGRHADHRDAMRLSAAFLGLFLGSYLLKLALLGREDLSSWTGLDVGVLRVHECFVAVMLLAGGIAGTLGATGRARSGSTPHRWLGRTAIAAGLLGLLTAGGVLARMYVRADLSSHGSGFASRVEPRTLAR